MLPPRLGFNTFLVMGGTLRDRYVNVQVTKGLGTVRMVLSSSLGKTLPTFIQLLKDLFNRPFMTQPPPSSNPTLVVDQMIVFVGLMGAGKSCVGRRVAQRLEIPFLDADSEVEAAAGCSIADIFKQYGEVSFRDGERRVIARLLDGPPAVLATGGGAFIDAETRTLILNKSASVWLRADLDTLVARTSGRTHRPLLNEGDPRATLARLIDSRYPIYSEANIVVDTGNDSASATCNRVIDALAGHSFQEGKSAIQ
jgi:shikimate kinase